MECISVGKCPAAPDHLGIDVIGASVADGDTAFVSINGFALASDPVCLDDLGKSKGGHLTATVIATTGFLAGLLALRRVDAVQPDLRAADLDGVTIDDARLAFEVVSVGGRCDDDKYKKKSYHGRSIYQLEH